MINLEKTNEIETKLSECVALVNTFGDYKASHHCKLGANVFEINDLELYFNKVKKILKNDSLEFSISPELEEIYQDLNESKDKENLMILASVTYYRVMKLMPYGELTNDIFLRVVKHLLMAYSEVFNDVEIVSTYKCYMKDGNKLIEENNLEGFVSFMLDVFKSSLLELKNM